MKVLSLYNKLKINNHSLTHSTFVTHTYKEEPQTK